MDVDCLPPCDPDVDIELEDAALTDDGMREYTIGVGVVVTLVFMALIFILCCFWYKKTREHTEKNNKAKAENKNGAKFIGRSYSVPAMPLLVRKTAPESQIDVTTHATTEKMKRIEKMKEEVVVGKPTKSANGKTKIVTERNQGRPITPASRLSVENVPQKTKLPTYESYQGLDGGKIKLGRQQDGFTRQDGIVKSCTLIRTKNRDILGDGTSDVIGDGTSLMSAPVVDEMSPVPVEYMISPTSNVFLIPSPPHPKTSPLVNIPVAPPPPPPPPPMLHSPADMSRFVAQTKITLHTPQNRPLMANRDIGDYRRYSSNTKASIEKTPEKFLIQTPMERGVTPGQNVMSSKSAIMAQIRAATQENGILKHVSRTDIRENRDAYNVGRVVPSEEIKALKYQGLNEVDRLTTRPEVERHITLIPPSIQPISTPPICPPPPARSPQTYMRSPQFLTGRSRVTAEPSGLTYPLGFRPVRAPQPVLHRRSPASPNLTAHLFKPQPLKSKVDANRPRFMPPGTPALPEINKVFEEIRSLRKYKDNELNQGIGDLRGPNMNQGQNMQYGTQTIHTQQFRNVGYQQNVLPAPPQIPKVSNLARKFESSNTTGFIPFPTNTYRNQIHNPRCVTPVLVEENMQHPNIPADVNAFQRRSPTTQQPWYGDGSQQQRGVYQANTLQRVPYYDNQEQFQDGSINYQKKYTPQYQGLSPQYQGPTPQYQGLSPQYQGPTPQYQGLSPQYQGPTPQYQGLSPQYSPNYAPNAYGPTQSVLPQNLYNRQYGNTGTQESSSSYRHTHQNIPTPLHIHTGEICSTPHIHHSFDPTRDINALSNSCPHHGDPLLSSLLQPNSVNQQNVLSFSTCPLSTAPVLSTTTPPFYRPPCCHHTVDNQSVIPKNQTQTIMSPHNRIVTYNQETAAMTECNQITLQSSSPNVPINIYSQITNVNSLPPQNTQTNIPPSINNNLTNIGLQSPNTYNTPQPGVLVSLPIWPYNAVIQSPPVVSIIPAPQGFTSPIQSTIQQSYIPQPAIQYPILTPNPTYPVYPQIQNPIQYTPMLPSSYTNTCIDTTPLLLPSAVLRPKFYPKRQQNVPLRQNLYQQTVYDTRTELVPQPVLHTFQQQPWIQPQYQNFVPMDFTTGDGRLNDMIYEDTYSSFPGTVNINSTVSQYVYAGDLPGNLLTTAANTDRNIPQKYPRPQSTGAPRPARPQIYKQIPVRPPAVRNDIAQRNYTPSKDQGMPSRSGANDILSYQQQPGGRTGQTSQYPNQFPEQGQTAQYPNQFPEQLRTTRPNVGQVQPIQNATYSGVPAVQEVQTRQGQTQVSTPTSLMTRMPPKTQIPTTISQKPGPVRQTSPISKTSPTPQRAPVPRTPGAVIPGPRPPTPQTVQPKPGLSGSRPPVVRPPVVRPPVARPPVVRPPVARAARPPVTRPPTSRSPPSKPDTGKISTNKAGKPTSPGKSPKKK